MKKLLLVGIVGLSALVGGCSVAEAAEEIKLGARDFVYDMGNGVIQHKHYNPRTGEWTSEYKVIDKDYVFIYANGDKSEVMKGAEDYEATKNGLDTAMNGRPEGSPDFGVERPQPPSLADKVDAVKDYLGQAGEAIQNNTSKIDNLGAAFQAQAAHTASEITRLDGRIDSLEKKTDKLKAGVAGANAIGSLTQYTGNGTHHVAVGIGGYEGASALAGGYTYAISHSTTVRVTVAYDSEGDFGYGASVGHSW